MAENVRKLKATTTGRKQIPVTVAKTTKKTTKKKETE